MFFPSMTLFYVIKIKGKLNTIHMTEKLTKSETHASVWKLLIQDDWPNEKEKQ